MRTKILWLNCVCTALVLSVGDRCVAQQTPSAADLFRGYRPVHTDVEFDTPTGEDVAKCRVEFERGEGFAGYAVYGPTGQVLRRFTDTNADGKADVYRFYHLGLEVYRDIDSNKNEKPDQHRWMNWGGTRWGIDQNEDGKIDSWRVISAQETARIAIEALIRADVQQLSTVMISSEEMRALKLNSRVTQQVQESISDLTGSLRTALTGSRIINQRTTWVRFDPPLPSLIPADDGIAGSDLIVYENAMAIVQNGESHDLVSIGEMVRIGEVWKLTQVPKPLENNGPQSIQLGGILMQPQLPGTVSEPEMSDEIQRLLTALQKIDESHPSIDGSPRDLVRWNIQRADVIEKLITASKTEEERAQWVQQFADGVGAAVQTGEYDDGLARLNALQEAVKANRELLGYVFYRRLLAEYAVRLKTEDTAKREEAQKWWLGQLEVFAQQWPNSADSEEAVIQLAISLEFMGRIDDARAWYQRLATSHADTNAGIRARGALRRLSLTGTRVDIAGKTLNGQQISAQQYQGKVLLVVFWATWATPFTDELPAIQQAYAKYRQQGFEILGVNLDETPDAVLPYMKEHAISWQQIRDAGGTDGPMARNYGLISYPTMFIVNRDGIVAGNIAARNLDYAVQQLLKGESLQKTPPATETTAPAPQ